LQPPQAKPVIFVSYAHADEPDKPLEGEVRWLSFVIDFLRPAVKQGTVDIWTDQLVRGGEDWGFEIERKLRACDIFILLVSRHSISSEYIVDKEIAIIRERQARAEDVQFYPLLLTPTPNAGLDLVRDKNWWPRDGKCFSDYSLNERYRLMSQAADEIVLIAAEIGGRKGRVAHGPSPVLRVPRDEPQPAKEPQIKDQESLAVWLAGQNSEIAVAIAARPALRAVPLAADGLQKRGSRRSVAEFTTLTLAIFRSTAMARVCAKYPSRANELRAAAALAARAAATATSAARASARAAASAAADAAACAAAASDAKAAAYAAADVASATAYAFANAAYVASASAAATVWEEVHFDIATFRSLGKIELADWPLWSTQPPTWADIAWSALQVTLPRDECWEVWITWYEDRLRGRSRGEDYEIVIANVPPELWRNSPAAANAWIKAHLP
jgi:hypothetical protein